MDATLPQCNALRKLIAGETVNYIPINNTAALNKKLMVVMKRLVKKNNLTEVILFSVCQV